MRRSIAEGGDAAIGLADRRRRPGHRCGGARSGDAGSRWAGRAGAAARGRERAAGHRADRPWRHRQCGVGDARGRDRFRGQAGQPGAAAGLAAQRAGGERAAGRARPHQAQPRRHADVPRHRHPQPAHAGGAAHRRQGRDLGHSGADRGPIGRRQGADRARDPRLRRAARQAVRRGQLRRHPGQSGGIAPVRPREGRLHGRDRPPYRQVRRGLGRHAVPGRGRRTAAGRAGQAAARHPGGRGRAGRGAQARQGRCPDHLRHQPRSRRPT